MDTAKKSEKFIQIVKHYTRPVPAAQDNGNWNYQPPVVSDKPLRRLIRGKIRPFNPAEKVEEALPVNPAANMRKVIDFALASLRESDKRYHCQVMFEMCQRIADCRNAVNEITPEALYTLFDHYSWACYRTGTKHSIRTPLSLEFKMHIWQGGRVAISNCLPVYNGCLPGEFHFINQPNYLQALSA